MIIIKVPGVNGNKESRNSGNAILKELEKVVNSKGRTIDSQILNLEEIHVNNDKLDEQDKLIYENSLDLLSEQDKTIFLGGDNSLSYSTISAFFDSFPGFVLVFDKSLDIDDYSDIPGNKSWLKALVERYKTENILVVGASEALNKEFFNKNKIKVVSLQQFTADLKDTTDFIMEISQGKPLYVCLDIGCVNEEGFSNQQILYIMKRIAMMKNLKALDIVEVDNEKKIKLASKILAEFL
ncbi:MAG: arginase family protein [Candidatus Pacearchaeota archaeon]|nr:arginase family protein [Candidatus Pacearchaeota archaeon]